MEPPNASEVAQGGLGNLAGNVRSAAQVLPCEVKSYLNRQLEERAATVRCLSEQISVVANEEPDASPRMFALEVESEARVKEWELIQEQLREHQECHGC